MEVTRRNFKETLPLIQESIKKSDFLAIDAEFTGLINGRDVSMFDTPKEYYLTLFKCSTDFLLIQFGLCAFYWDQEEKKYKNEAYNFYVFPKGRPGTEKIFLCQSSSIEFLASQGFDFNKVFKDGISYMTEPTEYRLREQLKERQKSYGTEKDNLPINEENKEQVEGICSRIRKFVDSNEGDSIEIDRCNAYVRRLLFQEIRTRFKSEVYVETKVLDNKDRVLKVSRLSSPDEEIHKDKQKIEKEWEDFEEAVGFSKVTKMISQSNKLVIGHNMLLDILHTLNQFCHPLPGDYASFKELAHCTFPSVLDTKYMSSLPPFKAKVSSNVLKHLHQTLSEPPFSLPTVDSAEGRGYKQADDKQHEAGYDAYVTGTCFLAMHEHLARMRNDSDGRVYVRDSALLKPFLNKLFLAKTAFQDSPFMNLVGEDPTPSREHVFHLKFPQQWQRGDLNQLFSAYGPITVQFLNDTSALVALSRRDLAKSVARALSTNHRVSLMSFEKYKEMCYRIPAPFPEPNADAETSKVLTDPRLLPPVRCSVTESTCNSSVAAGASRRMGSTGAVPTRKRTASGVFQVELNEPLPKKSGVRTVSENAGKCTEPVANGRAQISGSKKSIVKDVNKDMVKDVKKNIVRRDQKVMEVFDSSCKSDCVAAFKESDSWD